MDRLTGKGLQLEIKAALMQLGDSALRDLCGDEAERSAAFEVAAEVIAARLERAATAAAGEVTVAGEATERRSRKARVSQRVGLALAAHIRQSGAAFVPAFVLDLSTHGFRLESHLWLQEGARLWLRLPGLASRAAKIAWVRGPVMGCAFEEPLHEAVLDLIVSKAGKAGADSMHSAIQAR